MGFDCFMEVIGKCPIYEFIKINRDNWLKLHQENKSINENRKDKFVNKAKEWAAITNNQISFIKQIEEIEFENFFLRVGYYGTDKEYDESDDDEGEGFHLMNHSTLIFCEIILLALDGNFDDKEADLSDYLAAFDKVEDLSVKGDNIKITLFCESSYKGSEKLDIDYFKLNQDIIQIKETYPSMQVYTNLGIS